jgi:carbonic anhydrase
MRLTVVIPLFLVLLTSPAQSAEWTYDEDYTGQDEWGTMPGYEQCASGTRQSPVMLALASPATSSLHMHYQPGQAVVAHDHQSFTASLNHVGSLTDGKKIYLLESLALHSPSEHMIKEHYYPLEIQLMHKDARGHSLILAVFATPGTANPALQALIEHAEDGASFTFDLSTLLPSAHGYYAYNGSLTTPPCSEGIAWRVLKTPITLSHAQLSAITAIVGRNARLSQPLYMRSVTETP